MKIPEPMTDPTTQDKAAARPSTRGSWTGSGFASVVIGGAGSLSGGESLAGPARADLGLGGVARRGLGLGGLRGPRLLGGGPHDGPQGLRRRVDPLGQGSDLGPEHRGVVLDQRLADAGERPGR